MSEQFSRDGCSEMRMATHPIVVAPRASRCPCVARRPLYDGSAPFQRFGCPFKHANTVVGGHQ
eukprot:11173120-Lingulodinium_polyedra.AAC.1